METSKDFLSESLQNLNKLSKEHMDGYETLDLAPWEREILDMLHATKLVHDIAVSGNGGLSGDNVIALNRTVVAKDYTLNPHIYGRLRRVNVEIAYTIGGGQKKSPNEPIDFKELPNLYNDYSEQLFNKTKAINRETPVGEAIDSAAWTSLELIRFHPFVDGNGRTSRLLVDVIFDKAGLPYITDWGSRKQEYLKTVYKSFSKKNPDIYKKFLASKLLKSLNDLDKEGSGIEEFTESVREQTIDYIDTLNT